MFEVPQQCVMDWAWHLVSDTSAALNTGLRFPRDERPLPFACWVLQQGRGSSRQFLESSHRPALLSPSESHSTTHMWAALGTTGAPGSLSHWTLTGQLSKEEEFAVQWLRLYFQCRGVRVLALGREPRSHVLCGMTNKIK